jgi:hypothetical protein
MEATPADGSMPIPTLAPVEAGDPYGELYFSVVQPKEYQPPNTPPPGLDEFTYRLLRLPGSCAAGLIECPEPEVVSTPFFMKDVLATDSDSGALIWSPDGRFGVITTHPLDDLTQGWPAEEWEQFRGRVTSLAGLARVSSRAVF